MRARALRAWLVPVFALCVALPAGGVYLAGSSLIAPVPSRGRPPADPPVESVAIPRASRGPIAGWYAAGWPGRGAILLLHPLRSSRSTMVPRARFLARAGFAVLLVDLQAHGETAGEHIAFGHLESEDARAALRYLRERLPGERVGTLGISLGGAALLLGDGTPHADAVVLEAVYTSIEEATENRLRIRVRALAPLLAPVLLWQLRPRLGVGAAALRPIDRVGSVRAPVLVIAGEDDRHVTRAQTERLFAAAHSPRALWLIPGGRHEDLHRVAGDAYERRVTEFFAAWLPRQP